MFRHDLPRALKCYHRVPGKGNPEKTLSMPNAACTLGSSGSRTRSLEVNQPSLWRAQSRTPDARCPTKTLQEVLKAQCCRVEKLAHCIRGLRVTYADDPFDESRHVFSRAFGQTHQRRQYVRCQFLKIQQATLDPPTNAATLIPNSIVQYVCMYICVYLYTLRQTSTVITLCTKQQYAGISSVMPGLPGFVNAASSHRM